MARPKKPDPAPQPEIADADKIGRAIAVISADADANALALAEHAAHVHAVARQVGYRLPGDGCIDVDLIRRDIGANMRRSVEACLEVGRALVVLKAACVPGTFISALEEMAFDRTLAVRFMQAASRFSNDAAPRHLLQAAGTQSKLFELLVLDDEQIEQLELDGQTGAIKLDDVARMGMRELREAVRDARAERDLANDIRAKQTRAIDRLTIEARRFAELPSDEQTAELHKKAAGVMREALCIVRGQLRAGIETLREHAGSAGYRASNGFVNGLLVELEDAIDDIREQYAVPRPQEPEKPWIVAANEQRALQARRKADAASAAAHGVPAGTKPS